MDNQILLQVLLAFAPLALDKIVDNSKWYQKHQEKTRRNAILMLDDAENKKKSIPKENLQEPKDAILFPLLQTSIPYLEEQEIRKLFSHLLASAYDERLNEYLHPGFINIITQLSPNDARILLYFNNHKDDFIGLIASNGKEEFPIINTSLIYDNKLCIEQVALSLINLDRLGLIKINSRLLNRHVALYTIDKGEDLNKVDNSIKNFIEEKGYQLDDNETFITQLGYAFLKVCIE